MNRLLTYAITATLLIAGNNALAVQWSSSPYQNFQETETITYSQDIVWAESDCGCGGQANINWVPQTAPAFGYSTSPTLVPQPAVPSEPTPRHQIQATAKQPVVQQSIYSNKFKAPAKVTKTPTSDTTWQRQQKTAGVISKRPANPAPEFKYRSRSDYAGTQKQQKPKPIQTRNNVTLSSPAKQTAPTKPLAKLDFSFRPLEAEVVKAQPPIIDNKTEMVEPLAPVAKVLAPAPKFESKITQTIPEQPQVLELPAPLKSATPILTSETNEFTAPLEVKPLASEHKTKPFGYLSDDMGTHNSVEAVVPVAAPLEVKPLASEHKTKPFGSLLDDMGAHNSVEAVAPVAAVGLAKKADVSAKSAYATAGKPASRRKAAGGAWWSFWPWLAVPVLGALGWKLLGGKRKRESQYEETLPAATTAERSVSSEASSPVAVETRSQESRTKRERSIAFESESDLVPATTGRFKEVAPAAVTPVAVDLSTSHSTKASETPVVNTTAKVTERSKVTTTAAALATTAAVTGAVAQSTTAGKTVEGKSTLKLSDVKDSVSSNQTVQPTSTRSDSTRQQSESTFTGSDSTFGQTSTPLQTSTPDVLEQQIDRASSQSSDSTLSYSDSRSTNESVVVESSTERLESDSDSRLATRTKFGSLNADGSVSVATDAAATRDDFTCIAGIDGEAQRALYAAGYRRFSDIENAKKEDLQQVFSRTNHKFGFSDFGKWSSQAALAHRGDFQALEQQRSGKLTSQQTGSPSSPAASNSSASDDLTKIRGIGPATAELLRKSGITSFRQLQEAGTERIQLILASGGSKFGLIDSSLWASQARFASSGDWTGLTQWQTENCDADAKSGSQSRATESTSTISSSSASDDLTKIHGIGPATAELLRKSGITSFRQLQEAGTERTQQILASGGSKFGLIDSSLWASQARFAMSGDWTGLTQWQTENCVVDTKSGSQSRATESTSTISSSSASDDLTKIHGIGPATAELLRKSGITSFRQLQEAGTERTQQILASGGSKFGLIDSSLWASQARFAMSGDWSGLTQWQTKNCVADAKTASQPRTTQSTSTMSSSFAADDLTKISGIGPATQKVLSAKGIDRFEQVAKMSSQQLDDLFADLESRFRMQDTSTWPTQAQAFASQRSSVEDEDVGVLEDINSIRAIASDSNSTTNSTSRTTSNNS